MPRTYMPMRLLTLVLVLFAAPLAAQPQTGEADAVLSTVDALFDAMRAADSTALRATLHPMARLYTVGPDPAGAVGVRETDMDAFASAVGTPRDEVFDERLGDAEVRIDGPLATVWVPYAFYVGDSFSHCGTNAFQLARIDGRWRVLHVSDTRRPDGCDPSIP